VANYEQRIRNVERDLTVLKWMVGTVIALVLLQFSAIWSIQTTLQRLAEELGAVRATIERLDARPR
jgi:hypothetical protein